jgi:hypothetical protein
MFLLMAVVTLVSCAQKTAEPTDQLAPSDSQDLQDAEHFYKYYGYNPYYYNGYYYPYGGYYNYYPRYRPYRRPNRISTIGLHAGAASGPGGRG